jgi:hypothetical protein
MATSSVCLFIELAVETKTGKWGRGGTVDVAFINLLTLKIQGVANPHLREERERER